MNHIEEDEVFICIAGAKLNSRVVNIPVAVQTRAAFRPKSKSIFDAGNYVEDIEVRSRRAPDGFDRLANAIDDSWNVTRLARESFIDSGNLDSVPLAEPRISPRDWIIETRQEPVNPAIRGRTGTYTISEDENERWFRNSTENNPSDSPRNWLEEGIERNRQRATSREEAYTQPLDIQPTFRRPGYSLITEDGMDRFLEQLNSLVNRKLVEIRLQNHRRSYSLEYVIELKEKLCTIFPEIETYLPQLPDVFEFADVKIIKEEITSTPYMNTRITLDFKLVRPYKGNYNYYLSMVV